MVSYIITYRQIEDDRYKNLLLVLEWLKQFSFEVIIVEQDSESKLKLEDYPYTIKHIFVENSSLFNRSWGFNVGIKHAAGDILFFADSDMIVSKDVIDQTIETIMNGVGVVSPFTTLIDLSQEQTVNINITNFDYDKDYEAPHRGGIDLCSGIVAFTKTAIDTVYGWDERFEGWGGEDNVQFMKCRQLLRCALLDYKCYHLYHTRSELNGSNQHPKYRNNLGMFYHYNANQELILNDMKLLGERGNEHKYSSDKVFTFITCHKPELIQSIIAEGRYNHIKHKWLLVGNHPDFESTENIINVGKLPVNIEDKKNLLVYTAWYALVKNDLMGTSEYLRLLEYDSIITQDIEEVTNNHINANSQVTLWGHMACGIWDTNFVKNPTWMAGVDDALKQVYNIDAVQLVDRFIFEKTANIWLPVTNILVKKNWLVDFVEWFKPIGDIVYTNPLAGHGVERATTLFNLIHMQPYGPINNVINHLNQNSHQTY